MGKMTNDELNKIVKESLPGYKVSRRSQVARGAQDAADAGWTHTGTSGSDASHLEELRQKYLGADFIDDDDLSDESLVTDFANGPVTNAADDDADDDVIVAVEPVTSADPLDRGSRAKVAVISKKEKKVIGQQG